MSNQIRLCDYLGNNFQKRGANLSNIIYDGGVHFMIRDDIAFLKTIPKRVPVECRVGAIKCNVGQTVVVPVQIIVNIYNTYYEYFYDIHNENSAIPEIEMLDILATQKQTVFHLYDDGYKWYRSIAINNSNLGTCVQTVVEKVIDDYEPWENESFIKALEKIKRDYPLDQLWEMMG